MHKQSSNSKNCDSSGNNCGHLKRLREIVRTQGIEEGGCYLARAFFKEPELARCVLIRRMLDSQLK